MKNLPTTISETFENQIKEIQKCKERMEEIQEWINVINKEYHIPNDSQYALAITAIDDAINNMEVCSCAIEDQLCAAEKRIERLNKSYTEYAFFDVLTKTEFKIKDLSQEAQKIMYWLTEYDGTPERAIDFIDESFSNDCDQEYTPQNLSDYICKNKDKIASWFYDDIFNGGKEFKSFHDLIYYCARREAVENGEPFD